MFKALFSFLLIVIFPVSVLAQDKGPDAQAAAIPDVHTASVDALSNYIKQNFSTDSARVRAIYVWITNHIKYDVARLRNRDKNPGGPPQSVADVLATRYAVCQGYSDLFVALARNMGIDAHVVGGYTKKGGRVNPISHAWVAAVVGGEWVLFDPTWGAGYVRDDQFVKHFNNAFYKVSPATLIGDHMPFDPMYQLLSYPLTHKEFIEGKPASGKTLFQFRDSIRLHKELSADKQLSAELRRLESAGVQLDLLLEHQQYLKRSLQALASNDAFDEGGKAFHTAVTLFKTYIDHKNKQFSAIGDNDLRQMVDSMVHYIKLSRSLLTEAVPKTPEQRQAKAGNMANIDRFWVNLNKEKQFVEQYVVTDAAARKQLFMRR
jgi:hypothetical protein